jgi:hypothetical protein
MIDPARHHGLDIVRAVADERASKETTPTAPSGPDSTARTRSRYPAPTVLSTAPARVAGSSCGTYQGGQVITEPSLATQGTRQPSCKKPIARLLSQYVW